MIDLENIDLTQSTSELFEIVHAIMDERWELARDWNRPDLKGEERIKHEAENKAREEFLAGQLKMVNAEIDRRLAEQRKELKEAGVI